MVILGINDGYNASAALIINGELIAAVQEERLSRVKNHQGFPDLAVSEILKIADIKLSDIDYFAFAGKNKNTFTSGSQLVADYHQTGLFGKTIAPNTASNRIDYLTSQNIPAEKINFIEHYNCHLAAAYFGHKHNKDSTLIINSDIIAENICSAAAVAQDGRFEILQLINSDYSPGLVYSIITMLMGFIPLQEEFKIMGLAPYAGTSSAVEEICQKLLGFFSFDDSLAFTTNDTIAVGCFCEHFREIIALHRFDDVAGGVQLFTERFFCKWIGGILDKLQISNLALSGSVFMNVKLNKALMDLPQVEQLFVFPSCSDESCSIGAAYHLANSLKQKIKPLESLYLGEDITDAQAESAIDNYKFENKVSVEYFNDIEEKTAQILADGNIIARCKGRAEFGARALGNRSILAPADNPKVCFEINSMIKIRDFWMPFAPSILEEDIDDFVDNKSNVLPEFMIMAFDVIPDKADTIAAAIHPADKTARPQAVSKNANPDYYRLVKRYKKLTSSSVILNTSCNLHGLPMVYSAKDCLEVFDKSGLKYMALANYLVSKV